MNGIDVVALSVFAALFVLVTILGFLAANWRRGDLALLNEWGLAGRRFGTIVTWFLLGGDLYTAYTFIAVPAAVFGTGAAGIFALPYTIIVYPFVFVVMPRLWSVCRRHHYITGADFVRGRYDSGLLALAIALTGILAAPGQYSAYATLAFGSALALFMYPHSITGVLSANSRTAIKRNAALLPAYSFLLGLIALLGYMGLAAGVQPQAPYGAQWVVPGLFLEMFPSWFVGFAFGAIAIGALVPASIMSIAAANLFTRNVWREYFRRDLSPKDESNAPKLVSLIVKAGALFFIVFLPLQYAINLQLLGGVWIIQILPALVIGLYTRWLHRWALLAGWAVGMISGTLMAASQGFTPVFPVAVGGLTIPGYSALW